MLRNIKLCSNTDISHISDISCRFSEINLQILIGDFEDFHYTKSRMKN